jgi:hypothetical protein
LLFSLFNAFLCFFSPPPLPRQKKKKKKNDASARDLLLAVSLRREDVDVGDEEWREEELESDHAVFNVETKKKKKKKRLHVRVVVNEKRFFFGR